MKTIAAPYILQQITKHQKLKMMTDGNELNMIIDDMRRHGMPSPPEIVCISIPGARNVLENCFRHFLQIQGQEFIWQPEYTEVSEWLSDNGGRGLFLFGDCGRGKSLLARYVIPAIMLKYLRKVVNVFDIQQMNTQIDEVMKKHIISLDDIGTEDVSVNYGNRRLAFAEIMDSVEKHGKLVIISTNLKKDAIVERYGERTYDRIISVTKRVEFNGKSMRK